AASKLYLLGSQVRIRIIAELLSKYQNAIEWSAQLVGHVGQELGLVLRSKSQFLCLFFQGTAGLLDFLILAFPLDVLFGKLLRFLRQLLVGLLQFLLLHLEFGG